MIPVYHHTAVHDFYTKKQTIRLNLAETASLNVWSFLLVPQLMPLQKMAG